MSAGEWRTDPFRRHEYRYWDGETWTEHVADRGLQSADTPVPSPPPPPGIPPPPGAFPGAGTSAGPVNPLAIAALVLGILWVFWIGSVLAIIFGHVALSHIRDRGGAQRGRGMAIAGLVLGYVGLALLVVVVAASGDGNDEHTSKTRADCSKEALSLSIAEQTYFNEHARYTTEAELVRTGFASEPFDDFEVRLQPGGLDYTIIAVGDCASGRTVTA
jgi:Domain of unknown function (DUF4190)/Protein of unknown function (DUF2510)